MSSVEQGLPSALIREFDPRPNDAIVNVYTELPLGFLPLQSGGFRSPKFNLREKLMYIPRGSTAVLIVGDDFDFFLIKFLKKGKGHADDRVQIFYDGKIKLNRSHDIDYFSSEGEGHIMFVAGEQSTIREIDSDLSFQARFVGQI